MGKLWLLPVLLEACQAAPKPEPHMLALTAGQVGISDDERSNRFGAEYRFGEHTSWKLIPSLGVAFSDDDAYFASGELRRNFWIENRIVLTPSFGLGYFDDSESLSLGGELEFRSGVEVTYCFQGDWRLGIALFHLSNAGIFDSNPGTEALVVTLAVPLWVAR